MLRTNVLIVCVWFVKITRPHLNFTPALFTWGLKGENKIMEFKFNDEINERINEIVRLTDEKNYLANILEEADETGLDLELIIMNRIENLYFEIKKLEEGE